MYPFEIFFGIDLYTCFVALGIILALLVFRIFSKYIDISTRLYNFTLINGAVSIAFGFFSAVFFQSLYNIKQQNGFKFGTGATFMGGLAGGALLFLAVYFIIGRIIFKDGENISKLSKIADLGVCSISIAHACGRLGCLMAGCCYGRREDGFLGIYNHMTGYKTLPVQLYEAILLFGLFVLMLFLLKRGKSTCHVYLIGYSVWRFFAEYLRDDPRGDSLVSALTPSQLMSVLMLFIGLALVILKLVNRNGHKNEKSTK